MSARVFTALGEVRKFEASVISVAAATVAELSKLIDEQSPMRVLEALRFVRTGHNPLDSQERWNLTEQLNQTFTYLVTARGLEYLFGHHPEVAPYTANLGTGAGSDIVSSDGSVAAEAFSATDPRSNNKLKKDVKKVAAVSACHKYVFYYCPDYCERFDQDDVSIIPVTLDF